jgi:hypothetical protein
MEDHIHHTVGLVSSYFSFRPSLLSCRHWTCTSQKQISWCRMECWSGIPATDGSTTVKLGTTGVLANLHANYRIQIDRQDGRQFVLAC